MKRYDVVDFATPVTMFDAMRVGVNARLVVTATGDFEQLAYQTDNQYVVEVRQRPRAVGAISEKEKVYSGERLTLNFQDIEVRPLLQLLADTSGQNIVVSDTVRGRVTLRLQNVPWDQALDIFLKTKGLDMRRKENVIMVAPQAELAAQEKADLEAQKDIQEIAPLRTEFLTVNYAKASEIARLVKSGGGRSLLSPTNAVWWIYVVLLILLAYRMAFPPRMDDSVKPVITDRSRVKGGVFSGLIGIFAGFLGVGPGFLMMPTLVMLGYTARIAAATNSVIVTLPSFSAFASHLGSAQFDWLMLGLTSVSAVIGAWLGARFMAKRVKSLTLSRIFAAALVILAIQRVVILLTS